MEESFVLKADPGPVTLDQSGLRITAPGLIGSGTWQSRLPQDAASSRSGETDTLQQAIVEAGLDDRHTLTIEAPTPPAAQAASSRAETDVGDDEVLLDVPLNAGEGAVVLYADEAGVISLHYRQGVAPAAAGEGRAFGAERLDRFRIPLRSGASHESTGSRGLLGSLAGKLIKVLVVQLMPETAGKFASGRVRAWESKHRAFQGLHGGTAAQLLAPAPVRVDLRPFAGKRALLFIHGTTSSTAGAFGALARQGPLLDRLYTAYEGRVLGFNHHTMGKSVAQNVREFFAELGASPGDYEFDVICHSRGGLVARAIADPAGGQPAGGSDSWSRPAGVQVRVRRIVFVATPNAGTQLADPGRLPSFVERLTNYVNLLPDSGLTIACGALMALAGSIVDVGLPHLPGLADQAPGSELQRALRPSEDAVQGYCAVRSDYEPQGNLGAALVNGTLDRIFDDAHNDLVVPTDGVGTTPYFTIPPTRVFTFARERSVHHTNMFAQAEISVITEFLGLPEG